MNRNHNLSPVMVLLSMTHNMVACIEHVVARIELVVARLDHVVACNQLVIHRTCGASYIFCYIFSLFLIFLYVSAC